MQAHAALAALGTLTFKPTCRIVQILRKNITLAFPNWGRIHRSAEVRTVMKDDGNNLSPWGILAPGTERVRLFKFVLPPVEEPTLLGELAAVESA